MMYKIKKTFKIKSKNLIYLKNSFINLSEESAQLFLKKNLIQPIDELCQKFTSELRNDGSRGILVKFNILDGVMWFFRNKR